MDPFYEYFKKLNENVDEDEEHDINFDKIHPENIDNILNSSFTEDEILAVVKKNLKTIKSLDMIIL